MRIVAFSDCWSKFPECVPQGNVLVCAGNFTQFGDAKEIHAFYRWFENLPHKHKLMVYGGQEVTTDIRFFKKNVFRKYSIPLDDVMTHPPPPSIKLLHGGDPVTIDGVTFWGHPGLGPECAGNFYNAHHLETDEEYREAFSPCPPLVDVLITNQGPWGRMDHTYCSSDKHSGSKLLKHLVDYEIRPLVHIFGFSRGAAGMRERGARRSYNVANHVTIIDY